MGNLTLSDKIAMKNRCQNFSTCTFKKIIDLNRRDLRGISQFFSILKESTRFKRMIRYLFGWHH